MRVVGEVAERPEIAFLLPSLRGGGAERVALDLAQEAARMGHRVDMVVLNRDGAVTDDVGAGVRLVELERRRAAFALPALVAYLRQHRPAALLSTLEHMNVLAVMAGRLAPGTRIVVREANTVSQDLQGVKGRFVRILMGLSYRAADAIVAVSKGVAESLVAELGVRPDAVSVILNPVITPRVREGAQEALEHPWFGAGEPPVVLGVGRLSHQKGFDTLLRAFAQLRQGSTCRLVILGEGEERAELEALATELGIGDDVDLPGFVPNPFPYMMRCGLFVLSSRWEGLPNVLIQAMAVGAKAVATDCRSGPAEVTDGGTLAPLVPVDDVEALARAMGRALGETRRALPEGWCDRYDLAGISAEYIKALLPERAAGAAVAAGASEG